MLGLCLGRLSLSPFAAIELTRTDAILAFAWAWSALGGSERTEDTRSPHRLSALILRFVAEVWRRQGVSAVFPDRAHAGAGIFSASVVRSSPTQLSH